MSGGSYAAPMVGRFFNRFGGEIMSIARTKITLASDEEEEELVAVDEEEALAREEQRELILRALPVNGGTTSEPVPINPATPVEAPERREGILNTSPPLRPLSSESQRQVIPENPGLLRAAPVPDEE